MGGVGGGVLEQIFYNGEGWVLVSGGFSVREANQTWANEIEIHRGRETHGAQRQRDTETEGDTGTLALTTQIP